MSNVENIFLGMSAIFVALLNRKKNQEIFEMGCVITTHTENFARFQEVALHKSREKLLFSIARITYVVMTPIWEQLLQDGRKLILKKL